jgi:hypothetical protein
MPYAHRKLSPPVRGTAVAFIVDVNVGWPAGPATVQVTVVPDDPRRSMVSVYWVPVCQVKFFDWSVAVEPSDLIS